MPDQDDDIVEIPGHSGEGEFISSGDETMPFPEHSEHGNLQVAMSGLAQGFAATFLLIGTRAAQLAGDSQAMWSIAMTTPTVMTAHGMRIASEAGSGRSRVEANSPADSQIIGGGQ